MSKKAYVYSYPDCALTDNWHSGGGLLIVTDSDPDEAWKASPQRELVEKRDAGDLGKPDHVLDVSEDAPDLVLVFPDAGCC